MYKPAVADPRFGSRGGGGGAQNCRPLKIERSMRVL